MVLVKDYLRAGSLLVASGSGIFAQQAHFNVTGNNKLFQDQLYSYLKGTQLEDYENVKKPSIPEGDSLRWSLKGEDGKWEILTKGIIPGDGQLYLPLNFEITGGLEKAHTLLDNIINNGGETQQLFKLFEGKKAPDITIYSVLGQEKAQIKPSRIENINGQHIAQYDIPFLGEKNLLMLVSSDGIGHKLWQERTGTHAGLSIESYVQQNNSVQPMSGSNQRQSQVNGLDEYLLEISGQHSRNFSQEFSDFTPENYRDIRNIRVTDRFYATVLGSLSTTEKSLENVLLNVKYATGETLPGDAIGGLSREAVDFSTLTPLHIDLIDNLGGVRGEMRDGKRMLDVLVYVDSANIMNKPKLVPDGFQPNFEAMPATLHALRSNKMYMDLLGGVDVQFAIAASITFNKADDYLKDINVALVTPKGDTLTNVTGEIKHNLFGYIPAIAVGNILTNKGITSLSMRTDSTYRWQVTNFPMLIGRFYANENTKVNGKDWEAPGKTLIAEGTFIGQRGENPIDSRENIKGSQTITYNTNFSVEVAENYAEHIKDN